ncbi:universal stress protein [Leptolyngbya ohadii]|uniref:universal stress protein n=1 Tax=Leptolyngbya ohadii TaxID=1962290 RepID=UPI000B59AF09|nr:universal stress protein [Leptolyngbya ohadii]
MPQKILVAIDESPFAEVVFARGLEMAQAFQASLMLLHVLSLDEEGSPQMPLATTGPGSYVVLETAVMEAYQERWQDYEKKGMSQLRDLTDRATQIGVATEFSQLSGRPGKTICDLAKNWQADLIVVGRRGRSGFGEFFLGSVSTYVVHHAPCPVMVVPAKPKT